MGRHLYRTPPHRGVLVYLFLYAQTNDCWSVHSAVQQIPNSLSPGPTCNAHAACASGFRCGGRQAVSIVARGAAAGADPARAPNEPRTARSQMVHTYTCTYTYSFAWCGHGRPPHVASAWAAWPTSQRVSQLAARCHTALRRRGPSATCGACIGLHAAQCHASTASRDVVPTRVPRHDTCSAEVCEARRTCMCMSMCT